MINIDLLLDSLGPNRILAFYNFKCIKKTSDYSLFEKDNIRFGVFFLPESNGKPSIFDIKDLCCISSFELFIKLSGIKNLEEANILIKDIEGSSLQVENNLNINSETTEENLFNKILSLKNFSKNKEFIGDSLFGINTNILCNEPFSDKIFISEDKKIAIPIFNNNKLLNVLYHDGKKQYFHNNQFNGIWNSSLRSETTSIRISSDIYYLLSRCIGVNPNNFLHIIIPFRAHENIYTKIFEKLYDQNLTNFEILTDDSPDGHLSSIKIFSLIVGKMLPEIDVKFSYFRNRMVKFNLTYIGSYNNSKSVNKFISSLTNNFTRSFFNMEDVEANFEIISKYFLIDYNKEIQDDAIIMDLSFYPSKNNICNFINFFLSYYEINEGYIFD